MGTSTSKSAMVRPLTLSLAGISPRHLAAISEAWEGLRAVPQDSYDPKYQDAFVRLAVSIESLRGLPPLQSRVTLRAIVEAWEAKDKSKLTELLAAASFHGWGSK